MFFVCANIPKKHSRHTMGFWGYVCVFSTFNRVWIDLVRWLPIPLEAICTINIYIYLSSPFALANLVSESFNDWGVGIRRFRSLFVLISRRKIPYMRWVLGGMYVYSQHFQQSVDRPGTVVADPA